MHAQKLAPVYEQLGDAFAHVKDKVVIAKVDADGVGKPLGHKYGVTGFPSAYLASAIRYNDDKNSFNMICSLEMVQC